MTNVKIIIKTPDAGARLDKFLIGKIPGSRSEIQKQIKGGRITVNGKKTAPHYFLKTADVVEIIKLAPPSPIKNAADNRISPSQKKQDEAFEEIRILCESPDYLVVFKPAGLLIHRENGNEEPNLADFLSKKFPELKKVGEENRPGIVHRLDKEVSGLVLIPRSPVAYECFKRQFAEHKIKKEYLALVYGEVKNETGEIAFRVGRAKSGKMAALPQGAESGKEALTKFDVLQKFGGYTLLKLDILTGRTHQILVHLKALGYPIVGDNLYGKPAGKFRRIKLDRIFLHAEKLGFYDPNGKWQEFREELPEELQKILQELK